MTDKKRKEKWVLLDTVVASQKQKQPPPQKGKSEVGHKKVPVLFRISPVT